jgi:DNA-directed RNA polymerase subunit RPC12/RpoP
MGKANPVQLNGDTIYKGLNAAYTGGNIGAISNDITKIWNSGKIDNAALMCVKYLCAENNFVIDYAKTLYKPERPDKIDKMIKKYTKSKVPHFFIYAKDKQVWQVENKNNSVVNLLDNIIKNKRIKYHLVNFGRFDYRYLMYNSNVDLNYDLISEYINLNQAYHFKVNMENRNNTNINYIADEIKSKLNKYSFSESDIVDILVKYLYAVKSSKSKAALWFCYGDIIVKNLKRNIGNKLNICESCGVRYEKTSNNQKYCENCQGYQHIEKKIIICVDCGKEVEIDSVVKNKIRCNDCQKLYIRQLKTNKQREYRNK